MWIYSVVQPKLFLTCCDCSCRPPPFALVLSALTWTLERTLVWASLRRHWKIRFNPAGCCVLSSSNHLHVRKRLAQLLHFIGSNTWRMSPFCFSSTPDVSVVSVLSSPWHSRGERWLTMPELGQVASLSDSLICCLLHCCSSPANRGN